jgi:tetratricopeptide (TPR) repeat protein
MGPHFQRGQVLFDLKRYREAVEAFQAALAENPHAPVVHAMIGAALINLRRIKDASQAVRRALELAPDLAYGHYVLSFVHESCGRLAEAEKSIAEAVRLEPSADNFHRWAGIAARRRRRLEALEATRQALQLDPHHTGAIILRGRLLAEMGKLSEAHALYAAALYTNPENAEAQHALGSLQLHTGKSSEALNTLREARRLDPVAQNDAGAIALAYGRLLPPFRWVDRLIVRWHLWPPKRRWALFTALAALVYLGGAATGQVSTHRPQLHLWWALFCAAVVNYGVLPLTFDASAAAVGALFLRREFGKPWYSALWRPMIFLGLFLWHYGATVAGVAVSIIPLLGMMGCQFGVCYPLLGESLRNGSATFTGYVCLPLLAAAMIFGAMATVIAEYDDAAIGAVGLLIFFGAAYFTDDVARWIASWRVRRSPLLSDLPR